MEIGEAHIYFDEKLNQLYGGHLSFEELAFEIYQYQKEHSRIYRQFLELTGLFGKDIHSLEEIPFLPVEFFKTKTIQTGHWAPEVVFSSSGTTGSPRSRHLIPFLAAYEKTAHRIFEAQVIPLENVQLMGLLPTYLDNPESSLIHMVRSFGEQKNRPSQFFRIDFESLEAAIQNATQQKLIPVIFAVTYALLKLADSTPINLESCIVVETGGMKGLGKEMCKAEILEILSQKLNYKSLFSEYGMSEMQSQAYGNNGIYSSGFSMRVLSREVEDPISPSRFYGRGALNVVDLANYSTCSFIASEDLGMVHNEQQFEVIGRLEQSEIRGCNLLFS